MRRRSFLAALLAALAGCGGGGSGGTETPTEASGATPTSTASPTATPTPSPTPTPAATATATPTTSATPTPTTTPTASASDPATPTPQPGGAVSDVTLAAVDAAPDDPVAELSVRYNSRAQRSIDPGSDPEFYRPAPDNKFLVVRMAVENVGDDPIDLTPWLFVVRTSGAVYRYEALAEHPNPFLGATVEPGDTLLGWSAYELPAGVTEAILTVDGSTFIGPVAAQFVHDPALLVDVPP